jgi:methyl-accepting chemotaxis protein
MKNLGIKSRVIFLGTIPALLFAMILAGYAISNVFDVLNQSLHDRGVIIATQLAPAAEYGVISGNKQILQGLVQKALTNEQDLRTVLILDNQNRVLALSGREIPKDVINQLKTGNTEVLQLPGGIIFAAPIYRSLVEVDDVNSLTESEKIDSNEQSASEIGRVYVELSNLTLQNLKQDLIAKILMISMFGLMLSTLLAWWIGRNITKPIQEIAYAVNKVGEGHFAHTIIENSSGELQTLQKGFNSMATSLKHAYDVMQDKINDATSMLRHQAQHDDLTG